MGFLSSKTSKNCDYCHWTEHEYTKVKEMLLWIANRMENEGLSAIIRENCELDSWYKDHQRAYKAELQRKQEEKIKKQKIKDALAKLTTEEKDLLKLKDEPI